MGKHRPRSAIYGIDRSRLHWAQGNRCALCGDKLSRRHQATVDHVYPRRVSPWRGLGNVILAHDRCNRLKADRLPTGCEIVWLLAVNARLGVRPPSFAVAA